MDGSLYKSDDLAPPPAFHSPPDVMSANEPLHLSDTSVHHATSTEEDAAAQIYSQIEKGTVVVPPCKHAVICFFMHILFVCMRMLCVCIYVCVCVYIYIYIYIYIYVHTYIKRERERERDAAARIAVSATVPVCKHV